MVTVVTPDLPLIAALSGAQPARCDVALICRALPSHYAEKIAPRERLGDAPSTQSARIPASHLHPCLARSSEHGLLFGMALTKDQRNDLFRVVEVSTLNPAECDLAIRGSETFRIAHPVSNSYFEIHEGGRLAPGRDEGYITRLSVGGDRDHIGDGHRMPWGSVLRDLSAWTKSIYDWEISDPWGRSRRGYSVSLSGQSENSGLGGIQDATVGVDGNISELLNQRISRADTSDPWSRWLTAITVSGLLFVLCWICLFFGFRVDNAVALGWAVLPFSIALTLGGAWASNARRNATNER